jgi:hypothetical protein
LGEQFFLFVHAVLDDPKRRTRRRRRGREALFAILLLLLLLMGWGLGPFAAAKALEEPRNRFLLTTVSDYPDAADKQRDIRL